MEPEIFTCANHFHVLVEIAGFFDVAIRVQLVYSRNVPLGFGRRENNDGNPA